MTTHFTSSSSSNKKHSISGTMSNPTLAQYNADAKIMADFEHSGESGASFNYSKAVINAPVVASEQEMIAYLSRIQRGGLIQPIGCMLTIEEATFKIISYSENCFDLLGLAKSCGVGAQEYEGLFGIDVTTLFTLSSRASLVKAIGTREITLLNPIWVHSKSNEKPFYAILHRIDVGVVIDLEPAHSSDPALLFAGAVQSQKLAVRAISRLQSLPGGDIGALCDTVVEDVQKLTGFDRVMIYRFHEDEHGEVFSEIRRSDLEPYLGLHYPATDIPQAARFLFKQNRVRMICDCNAKAVNILQCEKLTQPVCLVNSTLRAPHVCHANYMANMGSIASLTMAILINNNDSTKLWGLVVCHHTTPRYVPFPLRYACEFLMQAFGLQLNMELRLAAQLTEKKILRMQTLLCDMLLRDAPLGIVSQSPNIMDLVKCDGAALYYNEKCWLLGVTPIESQVKKIVEWLLNCHGATTGLSTDCLANAGYPDAALLGDEVCGMATAKIHCNDYLFWFRSHTAKEVKWGGAKHHPTDKDDETKMHPRVSFKAFLEKTKSKSLPWEVAEINAIHSLQLIMRDSIQEIKNSGSEGIYTQQTHVEVQELGEYSTVALEMVRLIQTATTPIFGVDESGVVNGWNTKMTHLTGLQSSEAIGKSLVTDIVHEESRDLVQCVLSRGLQGEEERNVEIKLQKFGVNQQNAAAHIMANTCTSRSSTKDVVGLCFVGQDVTLEKVVADKFIRMQGDYKAIIDNPSPLIPPIFSSDENACCSEWNVAMEKLTGWMKHETIGRMLPGDIFGTLCPLKDKDALIKLMIVMYRAIGGHDTKKLHLGFFDRKGKFIEVLLAANKRTDGSENIVGCFCFLRTSEPNVQLSSEDGEHHNESDSKLKELAYIRQEIKNPLNGIRFAHKLLEATSISDVQKQILETSDACERQIMSILEDMDWRSLEEGSMKLNVEGFILENLIDVIVSQAMIVLKEKNLQLIHEIPDHIKMLSIYGDQIRLQLILSDLLLYIVNYASSSSGWVEIKVSGGMKLVKEEDDYIPLEFRMTHSGPGIPSALIEEMFGERNPQMTSEGLALYLAQKLLSMMNGHVQYVRDNGTCYFLIGLELKLGNVDANEMA